MRASSALIPASRGGRRLLHAVPATLAAAGTGAAAALFRFLSLRGFPNDHFLHLAGAQQMLIGEWPMRDFADPGLPLMYAASAAMQALLGPTLLSEAVLVALAFGLACALTVMAIVQLTGSVALALMAAVLEIAIVPRTYGYPKLLLYAAAFVLFQRYVSRPTLGRTVALALAVAVAFLFRHDHGLYLGAGAIAAVLLAPGPGRETHDLLSRWRRAAVLAGAVAVLLLPYLVFIHVHGGLGAYIRTGVEFSRREAGRQGHVWPSLIGAGEPTQAILVYLFHALPLVALAVVWLRARDAVARVVPLALVAILVNISFIREPLNTRLPDVVVPAVVLGAWLCAAAWHAPRRRWVWTAGATTLLVVATASVLVVGNTREEIERMEVNEWNELPEGLAMRAAELRERFTRRQMPTGIVAALMPFFAYVDRCTSPDDRLLVAGFMPEVAYYARRPFAGGQSTFVEGYYSRPEHQRTVVERLGRQSVPFMLIPSDEVQQFDSDFSLVAEYVHARYGLLTRVEVVEGFSVEIRVNNELAAAGRDAETGWPCFAATPRSLTGQGRERGDDT